MAAKQTFYKWLSDDPVYQERLQRTRNFVNCCLLYTVTKNPWHLASILVYFFWACGRGDQRTKSKSCIDVRTSWLERGYFSKTASTTERCSNPLFFYVLQGYAFSNGNLCFQGAPTLTNSWSFLPLSEKRRLRTASRSQTDVASSSHTKSIIPNAPNYPKRNYPPIMPSERWTFPGHL